MLNKILFWSLLAGLQFVFSQTYHLTHHMESLEITPSGSYVVLDYKEALNVSSLNPQSGAPDVPVYLYKIPLQPGQTVQDFTIDDFQEQAIEGQFLVRPRQPMWNQFTDKRFVEPDEKYYNSGRSFPQAPVKFLGVAHFNGIPIAQFAVSPVRYVPAESRLYFIKQIDFSIQTAADPQPSVQPFLTEDITIARRQLNQLLQPQAARLMNSVSAVEIPAEKLSSGLIDRYVIITTEDLKGAFQTLADWKTQKGVPTVIRTLQSILQEYSGIDNAEKMRNFIRWTYQKRGTKYVLLGGDTDIIPTRIIHTGGYTFAADYYFSDLDGSWNANGNDVFGEAADKVDAYPEVYVARVPVGTTADVQRFVGKLFKYEKLKNLPAGELFPANVLYMASNLSNENDGRDLIMNNIDPQINPDFPRRLITESGEIGSSPAVPLAELDKNYGLIFSESHGSYFNIRPGARGSEIYSYQMDNLTNTLPPVWYIASCYTNDILKRSFSEMYMLSKNGGGVAYIGNSGFEYPFSGIHLQKEFFNLVFNQGYPHLAEAHFLSRYPYLGYLSWEGPTRIIVFSTVVLGDAEMPLWTAAPQELTVSAEDSLIDGAWRYTVSVHDSAGNPVADAVVTLYKKDLLYEVAYTDGSGRAILPYGTADTNNATLTVTSHNYIPVEKEITIHGQDDQVKVTALQIREISGNGNQKCEPGERITINVQLQINNPNPLPEINKLYVQAVLPDTNISLDYASTEIEMEAPQGLSEYTVPFDASIDSHFPADTSVFLNIRVLSENRLVENAKLSFPVYLPRARYYGYTLNTTVNDSAYVSEFMPQVINTGKGMTNGLTLRVEATDSSTTIENGELYLGNLSPGEIAEAETAVIINHRLPPDSLQLQITLSDNYGKTQQQIIDFIEPYLYPSLQFKPFDGHSIELNWSPSSASDLLGYYIFRKENGAGDFVQINTLPVTSAGYFVDTQVDNERQYQYYIQAVDSSENLSPATDTITAWSAAPYQTNFPSAINPRATGSSGNGLVTYDFDGDGRCEIAASGGHGVLDIYNYDGSLIQQFTSLGEFLTVPAVGNVYGAEDKEVVVSGLLERADLNSVSIVNPLSGEVYASLPLGYNAPTSVVLKDLDGDGLDDIMVLTHGGNAPVDPKNSRLFIWRSTGSSWEPFPGWPEDGYAFSDNWSLGVPAAADIDNSGKISIIVPTQGSTLYRFVPADSAQPVWGKSIASFLNTPISLADMDGDGKLDIIFASRSAKKLYILNYLGEALPGWEDGISLETTDQWGYCSPAVVGNLDDDAEPELVYVGEHHVYIFNSDGSMPQGWPVAVDNGGTSEKKSPFSSPVLADLNHDGTQEIIFITAFGIMHALDSHSGRDIQGFPIDTGSDMVQGQSPVVDDIDRDGDLEVLFIAHEGKLFIWDIPQKYNQQMTLYWNQPFGNVQHTGELSSFQIEDISAIPVDDQPKIVNRFYLKQNYPNPFNPQTAIAFGLKNRARVKLEIFDILGQKVAELFSGKMEAGAHTIIWNGRNQHGLPLHSGVYFYRLKVTDALNGRPLYSKTAKMIFLK